MSTPVVTNKWAGSFDCDVCRRKRLMADEFSKKALERYRRDGKPLKCKACVQSAEEKERAAPEARRINDSTIHETRECSVCQTQKEFSDFNRNQWNKGERKSKCRLCVEKVLAEESLKQVQGKEQKLKDARAKVAIAKESGDKAKALAAESELAALEAELVTGLKPVRMNRGGGRGRSGRIRSRGGRGRK
mmetsp:Transcript_10256/g.15746  ORF Transcript_10256/g.15746 Transcript_10256/m.15746 type:complete len:190 (-) Transcript_10256:2289-2858(-)